MKALEEHLNELNLPHQIVGDPVLFDVVFTSEPVVDYRGVLKGDAAIAASFNKGLRERGILKPPSKFYISLGLTDDDLEQTVGAISAAAAHIGTNRRGS
jgi:glutamate-1-semialdehyde 2,1-aminomutase